MIAEMDRGIIYRKRAMSRITKHLNLSIAKGMDLKKSSDGRRGKSKPAS
jgi:hypothetical protein